MKPDNTFRAPSPTSSELKLRNALRSKKMTIKDGQVIWYTACAKYTPDLIVGEQLIIEVDGRIHDQEFQKTPDRIRQRALTNMGYVVFRVKNEEVQNTPNVIAERIIQKYFEIVDVHNYKSKITKLDRPSNYNPIPRELAINIQLWAISLNNELNADEGRWSAEYFKDTLTRFHPELVKNQCAMERLILSLIGLTLHKDQDGGLDFKHSLKLFERCIDILRVLFEREGDMAAVHLKNMYNITAPGFFKNLIFKGGPKINPGKVSIIDKATLDSHIKNFNNNFSKLGITVEPSDIKSECDAVLSKLSNKDEISKYDWLIEWAN
jgi:very-short-patch-repair endonuclease